MPGLVKPGRWTLRSHLVNPKWRWFWRDPAFSTPFWQSPEDMVRPQLGTPAGGISYAPTDHGIALRADNTNDEITYTHEPPITPISGDVQRSYFFIIDPSQSTGTHGILHKNPLSSSWSGGISMEYFIPSSRLLYYVDGSAAGTNGAYSDDVFNNGIDNRYYVTIVVRGEGSGECEIWESGRQVTLAGGGTVTAPASQNTDTLRLCRSHFTSARWMGGDLVMFHVIKYAAQAGEIRQWARDPFGPYEMALPTIAPAVPAAMLLRMQQEGLEVGLGVGQ